MSSLSVSALTQVHTVMPICSNLQWTFLQPTANLQKPVTSLNKGLEVGRGLFTFLHQNSKIPNFLDTLSNKLLSCDTAHAWQSIIIRVTYLGPAFQTSIHLFCQEETGSFARKCNYYTALLSLYVAWHFRMAVYLNPHFIEASTTNHNLHSSHVMTHFEIQISVPYRKKTFKLGI